ncbi:hypothetical protein N7490_003358 [Penicillium lividum]|nr:hypothetical protein N7490_003358 [Penicillium lividum]
MSDSKKPSIPSWQRQSSSSGDQSLSQIPSPSPSSDDAPAPTSREDLVNQAARFLEDESIRESSTDRKVAFLESKGLNPDEIQKLLGVSRNLEATSNNASATEDNAEEMPQTSSAIETEVTPSSVTAQSSSPSSPPTTMSQQHPPSATSPIAKRDEPPIITYPEFLFEPTKPPPLVTMQSVLYTLYAAAGLGASIYGASEYLVKPMLASLTSARHELSEKAQENLQKLNEKLEKTVSVIPPHLTARRDGEEDEESESVTSDPTELFHRDMGTQTTPDVSGSSSLESAAKEEKSADAPSIAVSNHMSRLESIQSQLKEIDDAEKESSTLDDGLRSKMTDLAHYLDGLIYSTPNYTAAGSSFGLYSGGNSTGADGSSGVRKAEDEAIANFKADIRGVKGALLSARNFPASRAGRLGGLAGSR